MHSLLIQFRIQSVQQSAQYSRGHEHNEEVHESLTAGITQNSNQVCRSLWAQTMTHFNTVVVRSLATSLNWPGLDGTTGGQQRQDFRRSYVSLHVQPTSLPCFVLFAIHFPHRLNSQCLFLEVKVSGPLGSPVSGHRQSPVVVPTG
jgi:hypothetical protein